MESARAPLEAEYNIHPNIAKVFLVINRELAGPLSRRTVCTGQVNRGVGGRGWNRNFKRPHEIVFTRHNRSPVPVGNGGISRTGVNRNGQRVINAFPYRSEEKSRTGGGGGGEEEEDRAGESCEGRRAGKPIFVTRGKRGPGRTGRK